MTQNLIARFRTNEILCIQTREISLVCIKKSLRNLKKLVYKFRGIGYNKFTRYTLCIRFVWINRTEYRNVKLKNAELGLFNAELISLSVTSNFSATKFSDFQTTNFCVSNRVNKYEDESGV